MSIPIIFIYFNLFDLIMQIVFGSD